MGERRRSPGDGTRTRLDVPVGLGAASLEQSLGSALAAGPVTVAGRGHKSATTAWQAVRAVGRHVGLLVTDATGSTVGVERTTRSGSNTPAVTTSGSVVSTRPTATRSSRTRSTVGSWSLDVELLPPGWSVPVELHGGPAGPVPDGQVVLDASDVVLPVDDGPGRAYVIGPGLRVVTD